MMASFIPPLERLVVRYLSFLEVRGLAPADPKVRPTASKLYLDAFFEALEVRGFEPLTFSLRTRRSTN